MSKRLAKKVLLIGWDAADWKVIHPLLDAGYLPTLERLVNEGIIGNLATLDPPMSPMLWTSIATGQTAEAGIGPLEPSLWQKLLMPVREPVGSQIAPNAGR